LAEIRLIREDKGEIFNNYLKQPYRDCSFAFVDLYLNFIRG